MPAEGLEPTRPCGHWILSPARLPIPPRRHQRKVIVQSIERSSNFNRASRKRSNRFVPFLSQGIERQTSKYIKTKFRATANICSHHEITLEGVVREKLEILFGRFVPTAQNSGGEFGEFVRETLLLLFRRFLLFARDMRYNRASHYNCEPRPRVEWPHVINSSVAIHSPPVSATWIWYHHHKHWHHGHYRSRR